MDKKPCWAPQALMGWEAALWAKTDQGYNQPLTEVHSKLSLSCASFPEMDRVRTRVQRGIGLAAQRSG